MQLCEGDLWQKAKGSGVSGSDACGCRDPNRGFKVKTHDRLGPGYGGVVHRHLAGVSSWSTYMSTTLQ
jgi:hypothetical protein